MFQCDARELQSVKDSLLIDPNNVGVGILHEPTGCLHLAPFDEVLGGHDALTAKCALLNQECKGFIVILRPDGLFDVVNNSHLNGHQGRTGSLQMDAGLFQAIVTALRQAGLR